MFDILFTKQVARYPSARNGKGVETTLICTDRRLDNFIKNQYRKYNKGSYNSFFTEAMIIAEKAINQFRIKDGGNWEDVLAKEDKKNYNRLISYIQTTIKFEIIKKMNPNLRYTTKNINGKREHVAYRIQPDSTDKRIYESEEGEILLKDILSQDSGIWGNKSYSDKYEYNYFIQWFQKNKQDILTKSQLELIDKLLKAQIVEGYTGTDPFFTVGLPQNKINERLRRIEARILKKWEEEGKEDKSFQEIEREKEINLWEEYISISLDTNNITKKNEQITEFFRRNKGKKQIQRIIDKLSTEDMVVVNSILNNDSETFNTVMLSILRKEVEKRVKYLKIPNIITKKNTQTSPKNKRDKNKFKEWEEEQKRKRNQPVTIYNENWEKIREITEYDTSKKGTYIINIGTDGTQHIEGKDTR